MRLLELLHLSSNLHDLILVPVPDPILVPVPISATSLVSSPLPSSFTSCVRPRVSTLVHVPVPAPSSLPSSFPFCAPSFTSTLASRSSSHSVAVPIPAPDSVPISNPAPKSGPAPDPVRSFPSLGPGYPLGAMHVYRHQALGMDLSDALKRYSLSA